MKAGDEVIVVRGQSMGNGKGTKGLLENKVEIDGKIIWFVKKQNYSGLLLFYESELELLNEYIPLTKKDCL